MQLFVQKLRLLQYKAKQIIRNEMEYYYRKVICRIFLNEKDGYGEDV